MPAIFITGADTGLGRALVAQFARKNYRVFAGTFHATTNYHDIAGDVTPIALDVRSLDQVKAAAAATAALVPALDILLNNAGIHLDDQDQVLDDVDLEDGSIQAQFETNTLGPLRCVQQFLPLLRASDTRRIINISSEAGSLGQSWRVGALGYCMSKAALNMQTTILVNHLGREGFRIVNIHPGWLVSKIGGPHADIGPEVAAAGVIDWALRDWPTDQFTYIDYQGKPQLL
ncbi:SDR family NAD(P)-dependent oxidoreductase [Synoicihabitans lomoniglobus]|uniref:SDR family NAD(P)-dependent oxidoreductase n=1 Tax=Synoicihabitans lomoniglobus TaxID=2909285 RepID=A0AAF0CSG5_9BACT|nr:SDR family NAD(P)-dependent oxidoreductase [Opitutaceae bacterium LMO-M01]WED67254.1 SDR family NAD(P)-dependent oxidoreductase [Opitutaceae bacterium LMO-M01]